MSEKQEYTAQVKNGPEIGNLISGTQLTWRYEMTTHMYVDGGTDPVVTRVAGWYSWTQTDTGFAWTFEWDRTPWDPDFPGCAPETCGGVSYDPCADSLKTNGRTHDILGDEMEAAGLDRNNQTLRYAVMEEGGVTHYQVALEIAEHEAKQEREIPVAQLVSGDSVYSASTKTWHEVRRSTAGQLYFRRDERWMPVDFAADVKFLTRRGEAGAAAGLLFDAFGGEVIEDA